MDLLVVLRGPFRDYEELKRIWEAVWTNPQNEDTLALSFLPYTEEAYSDASRPLARNVRAEGIEL